MAFVIHANKIALPVKIKMIFVHRVKISLLIINVIKRVSMVGF